MTRLQADWVRAPGPAAVMAALGDAYFVGGCVRNALMELPVADIDVLHKVHLRYEGTDSLLIVDFGTLDGMIAEFEKAHLNRFGFSAPERVHIVGTLSAEAIGRVERGRHNGVLLSGDDPVRGRRGRGYFLLRRRSS